MPQINLASAKLDGDRFVLPDEVVENARNPRLTGTETVKCWVLVVNPGRYRLATRDDVSAILRQIEAAESGGGVLDEVVSDQQVAIRARLMPCTISPPGPGWRVNLPKEILRLAPDGEACHCIFVLIVAGFIELWFPDALRKALSAPLSEVLSL
jgi:hypothetical protein